MTSSTVELLNLINKTKWVKKQGGLGLFLSPA
jgi:hypothetical protein